MLYFNIVFVDDVGDMFMLCVIGVMGGIMQVVVININGVGVQIVNGICLVWVEGVFNG